MIILCRSKLAGNLIIGEKKSRKYSKYSWLGVVCSL